MNGSAGAWSGPLGRGVWDVTVLFGAFTVLAVIGYGTFGLHPQWLPDDDLARTVFSSSFGLFAQLQVLLAFLAMAIFLIRIARWRWLVGLAAVSLIAFLAEHVGTGIGFPFGGYRYTSLLGPKLGGRVPALIPLSWFYMGVASYGLALHAFRDEADRTRRMFLAAGLLVAWDLALDPAMSFLAPYWIWEDPGAYYGMPLINLFGWSVTAIAIMAVLEWAGAHRWMSSAPLHWLAVYYGLVLLMPMGMLIAAGIWPAVAVTLVVTGALSLPVALRTAPSVTGPRSARAPSTVEAP